MALYSCYTDALHTYIDFLLETHTRYSKPTIKDKSFSLAEY